MYILIGIIFIVIGFIMLILPRTFYAIIESWKNHTQGEANLLFCISTRIGGAMLLVLGVASIIIQFTT